MIYLIPIYIIAAAIFVLALCKAAARDKENL
jgi:hypothetical protein